MVSDTGVKKGSETSNGMVMSFTELEHKIVCVEGGRKELTE